MTKYPVLDDCTRTANIIGAAASAGEAAKVYSDYMIDRGGDEISVNFYCRQPSSLSLDDAEDMAAIVAAGGAFEPMF